MRTLRKENSINRNILESKDRYVYCSHCSLCRVLIETYWNLKQRKIGSLKGDCRINRNILESKDSCTFYISLNCNRVLIETYWNVKFANVTVRFGRVKY